MKQTALFKFSVKVLSFALVAASLFSGKLAKAVVLDPLNNPSFEQAGATADKAFDWQDFGTGYSRVSDVAAHSGAFDVQLTNATNTTFAGAYQRLDFHQTVQKPIFIGAYVKGSNIVMAPGSFYGASLYAEIHLMDGTTVKFWNTVPNSGTFGWRWVGFNTSNIYDATGVPIVQQPIDYIFVVPLLGQATGIANFDDVTITEQEPTQSAISIVIDDGESTAFTEAKPLLDSHNFKATTAIVSGNVGTANDSMTQAQLQTLQQDGWEMMAHTVDHADLTLQTPTQADLEMSQSKSQLQAMGLTVKNFAFPFGAYNAALLADAQQYFTSARAFELGDNPQGTFPYDVKVRSAVNTTTNTDIQNWINSAKNNKRWSVIVFHSIAATGDDAYHTPPADFATFMNTIAASGVPVMTYDQGLQLFGVTPAGTVTPTTGSLTVTKTTTGGDGTFSFTGGAGAFQITTTAGTGSTTISNLAPGSYSVTEGTLPTGWSQTSNTCTNVAVVAGQTATCSVANTFVAPPTTGSLTLTLNVTGGDDTFGFSGDVPDFQLTTVGGTASKTFSDLTPGTYSITQSHTPAGWVPAGNTCINVAVVAGQTATCTVTNGFSSIGGGGLGAGGGGGGGSSGGSGGSTGGTGGNSTVANSGTITGTVFADTNSNGTKDGTEPSLSGWTLYLDANDNATLDSGETSVTSDANGVYTFTGLASGSYTVREVQQASWAQTEPNATLGMKYIVTLTATIPGVGGQEFGNAPLAGQVLGASTTTGNVCSLYISSDLFYGTRKNNVTDVKNAQTFLNSYQKAGIPVTGYFGVLTRAAVKSFQNANKAKLGLTTANGNITGTTRTLMNQLACPAQ